MSVTAANGVPDPGALQDALRRHGPIARYGTALALTGLGLVVGTALLPATDVATYTPLLGAVAIAVWFGGLGPGLLACGVGWAAGWLVLNEPRFGLAPDRESFVRWLVSLLVAVGITLIAWAMRRGRERAASAAGEAERTRGNVEQLLGIAASLSEASTPENVARAMVEGGASAVGASGASMALVEGSGLRLLDPIGSARDARLEDGVLPLESRSVIATAAREGRVCWADDRDRLVREFPDTARALADTQTLIALPLVSRGTVVGALGFAYDEPGRATSENLSLAQLVAEIGSSALERASAFEGEREVRARLEQILAVAPRFRLGLDVREVAVDVCQSAREAFAADVAQVWSVRDDAVEIVWREPAHQAVMPGASIPMSDLPVLAEQIGELRVMFRPDVLATTRGEALRLVRATGVSSALRIPVVVGGRAERLLVLEWEQPHEEPDATIVTLARRFADQAGLALEQAERRLAQEKAARRADETRRLLDLTAALAGAGDVDEVAAAILEQGARRIEAVAGVVVRLLEHEPALEVVRAEGEVAAAGSTIPLESDHALARAVRTNETVLEPGADRGSWLAVPLAVEHRAIGGIGLAFPPGKRLTDAELAFAEAVARQGGQALERARLLEAERAARARAERIATSLAQLHALGTALARAQTAAEVAEVVSAHVVSVLEARSAVVYVLGVDDATLEPLGPAPAPPTVSLEERTPLTTAIEHDGPVWLHGDEDWRRFPDAARATVEKDGTLGAVPLLVDGRPVGALEVSFAPGHELDPEQQRFVETIARQAAQPLERVRLLEAERRSRRLAEQATERTRRLQRVTEGLAAAVTPADVGDVAVREGVAAVVGDHGAVFVVGADGAPTLLASSGYSEHELSAWRSEGERASTPVSEVVQSGEPVVLESADELGKRYPAWGAIARTRGHGAAICAPLVGGGRIRGALYVGSRTPRRFDEGERLVALTLARQCGQALERAQLHESEAAAAERLARLQEVTAALSQASRAVNVAATCLEHAAAAIGATAGVVALRASDGDVAVSARVGYSEAVASDLVIDRDSPLQEVVRTGQPVWALSGEGAPDGAGKGAWAALPLAGGDGPLGALLLSFAEGTFPPPEDREWLVALAAQCAQALERSRLYEEERATRRRSERLQALTAALSGSLTPSEVASVLLEQAGAALEAAGAALAVADETTSNLEVLAWSGFPGDELEARPPVPLEPSSPPGEAFRRRRTLVFASADELGAAYPDVARQSRARGIEAMLISPLLVTGRALGVAVFTWSSPRRPTADELEFVAAVSSQCAQALDRARRYESERTIAETLQRSVLPERLPDVDGLNVRARYLPGTGAADVGGDWYDVIELESGKIGLVVGDVVGKGVVAAATMSQLRNALRAFASEQLEPAATVNRLNRLVVTLTREPFATLAYVELDPRTRACRYTLAGHPAPLVRAADGGTSFLEGGRSLPLGVGLDVVYAQASTELPAGATILLYTDGLVEQRDRRLAEGLELLRKAVAGAPPDPDALLEHVLAQSTRPDDRRDDVAVLVAKLAAAREAGVRLTLPAESTALNTVRDELRAWLGSTGADAAEVEAIVLAAWEACANAVEHAQEPTSTDFGFEASRRDDRVRLLVRDRGRWKPETERDGRGFGLKLMRSLMETVEVAPSRGGTVIRMERRVGTAVEGDS